MCVRPDIPTSLNQYVHISTKWNMQLQTYEKHIYPQHRKFHLLPDFLRGEAVEVKLIDESQFAFQGKSQKHESD